MNKSAMLENFLNDLDQYVDAKQNPDVSWKEKNQLKANLRESLALLLEIEAN